MVAADADSTAPFLPSWSRRVEWGERADAQALLLALPEARGIIGFADETGRIFALAQTANLRRFARNRLGPVESDPDGADRPTRRANYLTITRSVLSITTASSFESDWVMLHLARAHLPSIAKTLTDHWRSWWVHVNPKVRFPRLVKVSIPGSRPIGSPGSRGVYLGPLPDKHAAQRYLESLQGAFDLCRYHHLLVQSPNAAACAYKEIGRCPAPCDGTIPLTAYRQQVREAIEFAESDADRWRAERTQAMASAALSLDFERAGRIKRVLDDAAAAAKPEARHVDRLEHFRYLALLPSERASHARCFAIAGGRIVAALDLARNASSNALAEAAAAITSHLTDTINALDDPAAENLGLVCTHLFRPAVKREGAFIHCAGGGVDAETVRAALHELAEIESRRAREQERAHEKHRPGSHEREGESLLEEMEA